MIIVILTALMTHHIPDPKKDVDVRSKPMIYLWF